MCKSSGWKNTGNDGILWNLNLCCLPDVGRQEDTVHSTSITSLIPPLTGYRGTDCSSSVNQCVSNPCDPEGTLLCEELANTFRCVCQHGYTGKHCETPINRCVDGLCQHGSVCENLSGGFKCDCLPGRCTIHMGFISNVRNSFKESCTQQTHFQVDAFPCSGAFSVGV